MTAQSVILPMPSAHARFIVIRLNQLSLPQLTQQLNALIHTRNRLISQYRDAELKTAIGFGKQLWQQLYTDIPHFYELSSIEDGAITMPAVPADVFIHIASSRADLCFALSQAFFNGIRQDVNVLEERVCFRYLDSRDLTGFIDGTENPQVTEERAEAALLGEEHGEFADGSFIFAQRYVHDLTKWQTLTVDAQEKVIGRTKLESIELEEEHKPINAHISRAIVEDDQGEELEIVRHSLPYGDGQGEQGLFFVAYTHDLTIIDRMLQQMFGNSGDQIHDHLLHFTKAVDGAYYFAPSEELLTRILNRFDIDS